MGITTDSPGRSLPRWRVAALGGVERLYLATLAIAGPIGRGAVAGTIVLAMLVRARLIR
jgi:hypothetical protein